MRAKEIAYTNLQKVYSKVVAFCIYPIHIKYEYYLTKARVMSDSVNCNFARCAV